VKSHIAVVELYITLAAGRFRGVGNGFQFRLLTVDIYE
jgi:hypothetical protein